ncbi:nucleotide exchange factor GrpE [Lacticaseibacillus camelliae]|uniref:Protein GrpE n=1 Tax=Lacticaseibacillus camelliae DSM 22697 = JCM 13995 TaxID=1423730 RepID=A0A0R2F9U0_9LACO|nr:HSP-70 Cofactor HSP20 [Lacticaseibacillus camelliae DSM 22697 = JCM 13995]
MNLTEKQTKKEQKAAKAEAKPEAKAKAAKKEPSLRDEIAAEMQDDLKEEVEDSGVDVEALKKERDELEDKYLRAAAEINNMNKRFNKEREDMAKYDGQKLATAVLPVLDNLERALATEVKDDGAQSLKKGVEMVYSHLDNALKENGVTEIEATGKFDPNLQQAVQTVPADKDHAKDTVVQVLQKGYKLKDRVLRPAMVVVAN